METFLKNFIQGNTITAITDKQKAILDEIEQKLSDQIQSKASFSDSVKDFAPQIIDLVNRLSAKFKDFKWSWSFSSFVDTFKYVIGVSTEVWQIITKMGSNVVSSSSSDAVSLESKIQFGKDLVYYIWKIVDPLTGRFDWIPFKVTLEKWIIYKLADFGLRHAYEFFKNNFGVEIMDAKTSHPVFEIKKAL